MPPLWLIIAPLFTLSHPLDHHATYAAAPPVVVEQKASIQSERVTNDPKPIPTPNVVARPSTASHTALMEAAGISSSDYAYVEYIIQHESGWNPNAVNTSSGACGLGQQLPCGKWAHQWNDPVDALIDASSYAAARYGGWRGAYLHWLSSGWW